MINASSIVRLVCQNTLFAIVPYPLCLKDNDQIQQTRNYEELCKEAKQQRHCVGAYHNRIEALLPKSVEQTAICVLFIKTSDLSIQQRAIGFNVVNRARISLRV
jgi:hypothetical protein